MANCVSWGYETNKPNRLQRKSFKETSTPRKKKRKSILRALLPRHIDQPQCQSTIVICTFKKNDKQYDQHRNSTSTKQEWSRKEEHNQQMTQTNYIIIQTGVLVKQGTSWNKGKGILSSKYQVAYVQHTETKKTKCIFFFSIQYWQSNCCALRVNEHISTTYMKVFCSRAWP